jgi:uncharacterized OsmC-like protein
MPTINDYMAFKGERMEELRERLRNPDVPPAALSATARVAGGSGIRPVQVREFTIVTDSGPALAGYNLGPTAPELLLSSLASCLAHTFLIAAVNRQVALESLEVEVRATLDFRGVLEVTDAPPAPTDIRYEARIASGASDEQLAQLKEDVERLCPVLYAITNPLPVSGQISRQPGA